MLGVCLTATTSIVMSGASIAQTESDRYYLPQSEQPFEGTVDTRIGKLEFRNQYPSKQSLGTLLDSMDFHGATQAFLWGSPIASNANLQHYIDNVFKVRQGELLETASREQKLGILTANATTPYIIGTVNLEKTGPFVIDVPAGKLGGWCSTMTPTSHRIFFTAA